MVDKIFHIHSGLWIAVLFSIGFTAIYFFLQQKAKSPYKKFHEVICRVNIGIVHLQMMLGVIVMTHSPFVTSDFNKSYKALYFTVLHPLLMLASVVFVTLSLILVRKLNDDDKKHRRTFLFNLIALFLLIVAITAMPK